AHRRPHLDRHRAVRRDELDVAVLDHVSPRAVDRPRGGHAAEAGVLHADRPEHQALHQRLIRLARPSLGDAGSHDPAARVETFVPGGAPGGSATAARTYSYRRPASDRARASIARSGVDGWYG